MTRLGQVWSAVTTKLEPAPTEVGPKIADGSMTRDQMMRALRKLRREKVSFSEIARQAGYKPHTLYFVFKTGEIGPKMLQRMTWVVRGLVKGDLVPVRTKRAGRAQIFLPAGKALDKPELKQRIERCVCGKYVRCPCGAFKPARVQLPCQPSPIDAPDQSVVASSPTPARQPSQNARDAAPLGGSGYRPLSQFGKWPHK